MATLFKSGTSSDYTEIGEEGIFMRGDATQWDDQQVNIGQVASSGWFGGAEYADIVEYRSGVAIEFENDASNNNTIRFNAQINHAYKEGENIEFHIHIGENSSTSGTAVFKLSYEWANFGSTFPSASSAQNSCTISGVNGQHDVCVIKADISGTGKGISSILLCTLERLPSDASDDFTESVYMVGLDFHIPLDSSGSRLRLSK